MLRMLRTSAAIACLFLAASAQTTAPPPAFTIADVHPSPRRTNPYFRGGALKDGHYTLRDATMVDLIARAYNVDPVNVQGGPSWIEFDRYDIFAKAPVATSQDAASPMLRALLADRFKLAVHTDIKLSPAFVLSAGKTPKLKQSDGSGQEGCDYIQPPKDAPPAVTRDVKFSCHNFTMQALAEFLRSVASPYLTRPVADATGLKGAWDFDLQWTYEPPHGDGAGTTIFTALEKQLGLKLEAKSAPLPVVVIDTVNEKPTPNVADLDKLLPPPPPAEFEVAVVRPANPDEKHFNIDIDGSTVAIHFATLQTLIAFAWDTGTGKIEGKPSWLNDDHFDISGKAAIDSQSANPMARPEIDIDDVKEMLRSLLADRFKMISHLEQRPAQVFALTAPNPKMKQADPVNHASCKEGPGADGKDPRLDHPILSRLISCQNMTMPQFTQELQTLVSGYLPAPVIDSTGLSGAYDFTLSFSKSRDLRVAAAPGETDSSDDPGGAISLFDAVNKQLGLKLEKKDKVPVPVLAIDHIEPKPLEN